MKNFISVAAFMLIFTPLSAFACECTSDDFSNQASEANIERSELIAEGVIASVIQRTEDELDENKDTEPYTEVELQITDLLKGEADPVVKVYIYSAATCGFSVKEGTEGLFLFQRDERNRLVSPALCDSYIADRHRKKLKRGRYFDE